MSWFPYAGLALMAGTAVALQGLVNSGLRLKIGLPATVVVNAAIGLISAFTLWLSVRLWTGPKPGFSLQSVPWYLLLGGAIGVFIVISAVLVFPRLGATWALMIMILGQLLMALLADHYGWFGIPRTEIHPIRVLGVILVIVGCFLTRRT